MLLMKRPRDGSLNPPLPVTLASPESSRLGRDLLTALRVLEKKNYNDLASLENVLGLLQTLIERSSRLGLLQGDVSTADKVLASSGTKQGAPSAQKGGRQGKRGRSKDVAKDDLVIHTGAANGEESGSGSTATLDVQLIMSAVTRILGVHNDAETTQTNTSNVLVPENKVLVVALAADFCTAVCEFVKSQPSLGTCTMAEYELMASSGKLILAGLTKTVGKLLSDIGRKDGIYRVSSDQQEQAHAVSTCLRASASLVGLFGTKLSRATPVLTGLQGVAWDGLTVADDNVTQAAAVLFASLPLAGGTDRTTAAEVWNVSIADSFGCLFTIFKAVAPITKRLTGPSPMSISNSAEKIMEDWLARIQNASLESERVESFMQYMKGLTCLIVSLLDRNTVGVGSPVPLLATEIDVAAILDLLEVMLSFPVTSESTYYGTKKRLRQEPVDNGLLSPASIASDTANRLKICGHEILDTVLTALGGPLLLPYGRRIARVTYSSLLTACSSPLRKVLDPTSAVQLDGKKRRWLHSAVLVRTMAVETMLKTVVTFGVDATLLSGRSVGASSKSANNVDKTITVLGGCLVEQLSPAVAMSQPESGEWGSFAERTLLTAVAASCLATYVTTGGEYLSFGSRSLVESIASTGLASIISVKVGSMSSFGAVKAALLALGTACVCTPWPDGAASSIDGLLRQAAKSCQQDRETSVSSAAAVALKSCDVVSFPRVPALQVITRSAAPRQSNPAATQSAEAIAESLESAKAEIAAAQIRAIEKEEQQRLERKSRDEAGKKAKKLKASHQTTEQAVGSATDEPLASKQVASRGDAKAEEPTLIAHPVSKVDSAPKEKKAPLKLQEPVVKSDNEVNDGSDGDEDDFPMIVDCAPDMDDK